jgi:hypothetical protein
MFGKTDKQLVLILRSSGTTINASPSKWGISKLEINTLDGTCRPKRSRRFRQSTKVSVADKMESKPTSWDLSLIHESLPFVSRVSERAVIQSYSCLELKKFPDGSLLNRDFRGSRAAFGGAAASGARQWRAIENATSNVKPCEGSGPFPLTRFQNGALMVEL